jgi:succinate dehydrogenase / fumarate reductase membrane anchor subunit
MVKSVLSVSHRGLKDWVIQRLSAILMGLYFVGLIAFFAFHPDLSFAEWHELFAQIWMKIVSLIVLAGILFHAWVGLWTIFTDYVKCSLIRACLHTIVFFMLLACFIWGFIILWSV